MNMNFRGYCRSIALGSRHAARSARICLALKSQTVGACRRKINGALKRGALDQDAYDVMSAAIDELQVMFKKGIQTHVAPTPKGVYRDMGDGCHERMVVGVASGSW